MKNKLIRAHDLYLSIRDDIDIGATCFARFKEHIDEAHAIDAVEVVHGRWIWDNRFHDYTCSECHNWDLKTPNYCSNCGAKMDGDE